MTAGGFARLLLRKGSLGIFAKGDQRAELGTSKSS